MKRRNKKDIEYFDKRLARLFERYPEMKRVENRYKALRLLLRERYGEMWQNHSDIYIEDFLKEIVCIDRDFRRKTEDIQQEEKQRLSGEFVVNHYNLSPIKQ